VYMCARRPFPTMYGRFSVIRRFGFVLVSVAAFLSATRASNAAIGPVTDLEIVNAAVEPDGFSRPYDVYRFLNGHPLKVVSRAVLAGGTYPGPLITGKKVQFHPIMVNLFFDRSHL
jgi:hypothetical protein